MPFHFPEFEWSTFMPKRPQIHVKNIGGSDFEIVDVVQGEAGTVPAYVARGYSLSAKALIRLGESINAELVEMKVLS